ncbi:hypothetical protein EV643_108323 [Kribbella sp. VKM Ac-2527]|uniref:Uncharacterized protein n=1 Tax=Kribbella caucasensis TaxID=2512215 RepID=A0A4R6KDW8_9ACTN|nr:hypothetical protein EV643_108323 [Kribbella sp. VKM Ac-2527]
MHLDLYAPPDTRQRLEQAGVIAGYRDVIDPVALGRGLEVLIDVEIYANDRKTVEEFVDTVASYEKVTEFSRRYGAPTTSSASRSPTTAPTMPSSAAGHRLSTTESSPRSSRTRRSPRPPLSVRPTRPRVR